MTKITLPPCKFYEGACPKINKKPCNFTNTYECPYYEPMGGFDAVAAAVIAADCDYDVTTEYDYDAKGLRHKANVYTDGGQMGYPGKGPTPTAALVAAVLAYNELATLPEKAAAVIAVAEGSES